MTRLQGGRATNDRIKYLFKVEEERTPLGCGQRGSWTPQDWRKQFDENREVYWCSSYVLKGRIINCTVLWTSRTEKFTDALLMYSKVELFTVLYCVLVEQISLLTLIRTQRSKLLCTSRIEKFANALLMYSKFEYSYVY